MYKCTVSNIYHNIFSVYPCSIHNHIQNLSCTQYAVSTVYTLPSIHNLHSTHNVYTVLSTHNVYCIHNTHNIQCIHTSHNVYNIHGRHTSSNMDPTLLVRSKIGTFNIPPVRYNNPPTCQVDPLATFNLVP